MKLSIDIDRVAREMTGMGFTKDKVESGDTLNGWTDSIMDILTNIYNLEGKVCDAIKRRRNEVSRKS